MSKKVTHTSFQNSFNGNTTKLAQQPVQRASAPQSWKLTAKAPTHHGSRWSAQSDTHLKRLAGVYETSIIAKTLDRTADSVKWRAKELGISLRVRKSPLSKPMVKTVQAQLWPVPLPGASKTPLSKPAIKTAPAKKPSNHNSRWSAEADAVLVKYFKQGFSPAAIGAGCSRTVSSVASRLKALGYLSFDKTAMQFMTIPTVWMQV